MAKDFESLKQQALLIKNEVDDGANTAERIGGILEDILDFDNEKLTELSDNVGLYNVDKNVPLGSGFYTSTTARAAVPTSVRKLGLIITYKTDATTSVTEQFIGSAVSAWATDTNWKNVGSEGGNKILEWNTDVETTRKQVPQKERKTLLQISYKNADGEIINEQYIGTTFTDTEWVKDSNWEKTPNQKQITDIARKTEDSVREEYTDADFSIGDKNGNEILRIEKGNIKTKNFDSEKVCKRIDLIGKKISIVGDSISTYSGYIVDGYTPFYPNGDVNNVDKTWWGKLIKDTGMILLRNASWSGSKVTGDSNSTAIVGCSTQRVDDLSDGENEPDIVIIYISVNDWGASKQLGDIPQNVPLEGEINDVSAALYLLGYKILTTYINCKLYYCTLIEVGTDTFPSFGTEFPRKNGSGLTITDYNQAIKDVAHNLGAKVLDLHTLGITIWNCDNYTTPGGIHPNEKGMNLIEEYIYNNL